LNKEDLKQKWRLGLLLSLCSVFFWGFQPLALDVLVKTIPVNSLAFYKLFSSALIFSFLVVFKSSKSKIFKINKYDWSKLLAGAILLSVSYIAYNSSFLFLSPSQIQIYFQTSKIFFIFIGVFVFKENFEKTQWIGLFLLIFGFLSFFHNQFGKFENGYILGVSIVILSSISWAGYAAFQKKLIRDLSTVEILAIIYLFASVLLVRFAEIESITKLNFESASLLIIVCLSNFLAYACFTESLKYWDASRVGAIQCLVPIFTLILMLSIGGRFSPMVAEHLDSSALIGALIVVVGALLISSAGGDIHHSRKS
jgi:drug/metabolite transporter (DMT)-like permease